MSPAASPGRSPRTGRMRSTRSSAPTANRHGSYNVFIIPVESGKPRRLTFDSSNEMVPGWSPDGKSVLFASMRTPSWPVGLDLYTVPIEGGRPQRITTTEGREGVFSPDGKHLAYVRGPGAWYRKGYRGSSNDDIWICDADGSNNRQLTAFTGQDNSPMWSADGHWVYYVSEFHGTPANIVRLPASAAMGAGAASRAAPSGPARPAGPTPQAVPQQITFHKDDGVRKAPTNAAAICMWYRPRTPPRKRGLTPFFRANRGSWRSRSTSTTSPTPSGRRRSPTTRPSSPWRLTTRT